MKSPWKGGVIRSGLDRSPYAWIKNSNGWQGLYDSVITAPPFTFSVWMRPTTGFQIAMGIRDADVTFVSFYLENNASQQLLFIANDGASSSSTVSGFTNGVWHHAAGVARSATNRQVYRDGIAGNLSTTSRSPAAIHEIRLGTLWGGASGHGLYEPAIWNVDLSDFELLQLARGVSPERIRPNNLTYFWKSGERGRFGVSSGLLTNPLVRAHGLPSVSFVPPPPVVIAENERRTVYRVRSDYKGGVVRRTTQVVY